MSKVKTFSRWFKHFSSLGDSALEQAIVSVFDRAERAEVYKELDQNPDIDMHDMVCCIAYADHCTAPLLARIAELEAIQPSALKEKLRCADERIAELEAEAAKHDEELEEWRQHEELQQRDLDAATSQVDALCGRIAELEAAQTWQPIESAPSDETEILVLTEGGNISMAYWCETWERWCDVWSGDVFDAIMVAWMPLPTPPKGDAS